MVTTCNELIPHMDIVMSLVRLTTTLNRASCQQIVLTCTFFVTVCSFVITVREVVFTTTASILRGLFPCFHGSMIRTGHCIEQLSWQLDFAANIPGNGSAYRPFLCGFVRLFAFAPPGLVRGPATRINRPLCIGLKRGEPKKHKDQHAPAPLSLFMMFNKSC